MPPFLLFLCFFPGLIGGSGERRWLAPLLGTFVWLVLGAAPVAAAEYPPESVDGAHAGLTLSHPKLPSPTFGTFRDISSEVRVAAGKGRRATLSVPIEDLEDPHFDVWPEPADPEFSPEKQALRDQFREARKALVKGDEARAAAIFQPLIRTYPVLKPYILRDLARIALVKDGLDTLSRESAAKVLELATRMMAEPGDVQNGWGYYLRGRALLGLGRPEEAEADFSVSLAQRSRPEDPLILYYLGKACEASGRPDDAYTFYRRAEEGATGWVETRSNEAVKRLKPRLEVFERSVDWKIRLEELASALKRRWVNESVLDAIAEARKECDIPLCELELNRLEGFCLLKLNRLDDAEKILMSSMEKEIKAGSPNWKTIYELQRTLGQQGKRDERIQLLEKFVAANPPVTGSQAYFILAVMAQNDGDWDRSVSIYREVMARFPGSSKTLDAHWRMVWSLIRNGETISALEGLRERLGLVAEGSEDEAQARYWLARMLEDVGEPVRASAVLDDIQYRFRDTYYGVISGWRLDESYPRVRVADSVDPPKVKDSFPGEEPAELGLKLLFPGFEDRLAEIDAPVPRIHMERAKELWLMGYGAEARMELLAASNHPSATAQVQWMASALRYVIGSLFYGVWYGHRYLPMVPGDEAVPEERLALVFPMPYREAVFRHALARGLEPAVVGALIQQESTFRPTIRSPVGATGLMQIMPYTGREICGWLKIRHFRTRYLTRADFNLRLGTEYFRAMLERYDDSLVKALASYNAGPAAVDRWVRRDKKKLDDDYFVEEIPYSETRDYVRKVIRNVGGYLETYGTWLPKKAGKGKGGRTAQR